MHLFFLMLSTKICIFCKLFVQMEHLFKLWKYYFSFWDQSFEIDYQLVCPCSSVWFIPEEASQTYKNIIAITYNASIAIVLKKKKKGKLTWLLIKRIWNVSKKLNDYISKHIMASLCCVLFLNSRFIVLLFLFLFNVLHILKNILFPSFSTFSCFPQSFTFFLPSFIYL